MGGVLAGGFIIIISAAGVFIMLVEGLVIDDNL